MVETGHNTRRWGLALGAVLVAVTLFRMGFMTTLPLSGDESYHWEWSRHPALGYYDHPPVTAYVIWLCTHVCGGSTEFSVRLGALLAMTGAAIVGALLAGRIAGTGHAGRAAWVTGILLLIVPVFAFFSMYMSTDPLLLFFWMLTLYLYHRAFRGGGTAAWLVFGVGVGLMLFTKFLGVFLLGAIGLHVLMTPEGRAQLRRPGPYLAVVPAVVILAPFLWWNARNGWATFMFNFVYRQGGEEPDPLYTAEFIGAQALAVSPLLFVLVLAAVGRGLARWRREGDSDGLLLSLSCLVPLVYFLAVSFLRRVGMHWPAVAWLGAIVALGVEWGKTEWGAARGRRVLAGSAVGLCLLVTVGVHAFAHVPPGLIEKFDWAYEGDPDRLNTGKLYERFGWHELGAEVAQVRDELLARPGSRGVFIICEKYGLASNVAFYTPDQPTTHLWSRRKRHGENYRYWDDFAALRGMDAVMVAKKRNGSSVVKLPAHFEHVDAPELFTVSRNGRDLRSFYIVRCYTFDGKTPDFSRPR